MDTTTPSSSQDDLFDADIIAKQVEYPWPHKVRALIRRNLPALRSIGPIIYRTVPLTTADGSPWEAEDYQLNRTQASLIAALVPTPIGGLSGAYMAELEALFHAGHLEVADTPEAAVAVKAALDRHRERQRRVLKGA